MKHRSPLSATRSFGEGAATRNPAQPNAIDFCVDVEGVIMKVLKDDSELLAKFIDVYLLGTIESIEKSAITAAEQSYLEQRMGRQFIVAGISPAMKYFTAVRGRKNG